MAHIFADYASTTPCAPEVVEAMLPYFVVDFGNPASRTHEHGRRAHGAIERAREQVAAFINARPHEILFAASSTEANNIAIQGMRRTLKRHHLDVAYTLLEHKSVSRTMDATAHAIGQKSHVLDVGKDGAVSIVNLRSTLDDGGLGLISLQFANNEIGTIQDLSAVARLAHQAGAAVHSDATQGLTTHAVDVRDTKVDLLSFSAHKIYGPKGAAALYVRGGVAEAQLEPIMFGGEHEWGLRPGTANVPAIVGMGVACEFATRTRIRRRRELEQVRDEFERVIRARVPNVIINGYSGPRVPSVSSVTFPDVEAEAIIARLRTTSLAFGAACDSGALTPSPVLTAIGLPRRLAFNTIQVSFGDGFAPQMAVDLAIEIASAREQIELMG